MASLITNSRMVVIDSGGLQKEAFFHRKPCLILRHETEWLELIDSGWSQLVNNPGDGLRERSQNLFIPNQWDESLFGNGSAGDKIADYLEKFVFAGDSS